MLSPQVLWPPPKFIRLAPLRPIMSSRGSITYGMAKVLPGIIFPLLGQSPHHHRHTSHFVEHIKQVKLEAGEVITSFDVKTLFTSVPVQVVQQKLSQDTILPQRTNMFIPQIITLLGFCLKNTYFLFHGMYYEQVHGAVIGSPISPSLPTYS